MRALYSKHALIYLQMQIQITVLLHVWAQTRAALRKPLIIKLCFHPLPFSTSYNVPWRLRIKQINNCARFARCALVATDRSTQIIQERDPPLSAIAISHFSVSLRRECDFLEKSLVYNHRNCTWTMKIDKVTSGEDDACKDLHK